MKKRILLAAIIAALAFSNTAAAGVEAPTSDPMKEPTVMRVTCYTDAGTTASGCQTREGIVATKREWIDAGYIVEIWSIAPDGDMGEFLGYYEPKDTGYGIATGIGESKIKKGKSLGSIEAGWSIDVFCESPEEVKEWQAYGDYFYVYILPDCKG